MPVTTSLPAPSRGGSRTITSALEKRGSNFATSPVWTETFERLAKLRIASAVALLLPSTRSTLPESPTDSRNCEVNRPTPPYRSRTLSPGCNFAYSKTTLVSTVGANLWLCQKDRCETSSANPFTSYLPTSGPSLVRTGVSSRE